MMQKDAIHLLRWVERMNRPGAEMIGFENRAETYFDADEIPATLIDLLRALAEDFVPETLAAAQVLNAWISKQDDLPTGTVCRRNGGRARFEIRGTPIEAMAQPYRFYLLQRVQDEFDALGAEDRAEVTRFLDACGMMPVLDARLTRKVGFAGNLEVWL